MTTIYTGLDIAKLNLQLHLVGRVHDLPNTAAGHRRLLKLLASQPGVHLIKRTLQQNPSKKIQVKPSGSESGCLLGGKGGCHVPLSRRDIMRIARRFNAGKHPVWHTSPEGTAEGWVWD